MPKKLFITVSPRDRTFNYSKLKYINPQRCVFLDDRLVFEKLFKKYSIKRYVIYPELDPKGRLHYHGRIIVSPSQECSFYKSIKPRLERNIGFVDVSTVVNELENLIYCMKDWGKTQSIIEESRPITPRFLLHTVGGRKGFKSPVSGLDTPRSGVSHSILEYLEGLSLKDKN